VTSVTVVVKPTLQQQLQNV